ncbi:MAG: glucose-6-phosphate dehydrogenase, partial [Acidobacteria bacterium]
YRDAMRQALGEALKDGGEQVAADNPLIGKLYYHAGDADKLESFQSLKQTIERIERERNLPGNRMFYLSVAPEFFSVIVENLAAATLIHEKSGKAWSRVIIEKPFGHDLDSARALNTAVTKVLDESQIYRIDHYLGKETVQNIMAFRFANGVFEPIWNRRYVDHVQMTVADDAGVGKRGAYYDKAGALRDIVQNHMFQVMTLVAMEPPISFGGEDVRDEKVRVLHAVPPLGRDEVKRHVVRAHYEGYTTEPNVDPQSRTETFVAMRLFIDNWRWAGVPFYLRTGKRLPQRVTEVAVQFKRAPLMLFSHTPIGSLSSNAIVLRIQPDEGISLCFDAKVPGPFERLDTVTMNFSYAEHFKSEPATGYETLLFDAMIGDQTLFHRMDMVEAGWQTVAPILDEWKADPTSRVPVYTQGSWGPSEADVLIERDGREWRD